MAWNIHESIAGDEAIAAEIRRQRADIVLLTEVDKFLLAGVDHFASLRKLLDYPYAAWVEAAYLFVGGGNRGLAVFARFPILGLSAFSNAGESGV